MYHRAAKKHRPDTVSARIQPIAPGRVIPFTGSRRRYFPGFSVFFVICIGITFIGKLEVFYQNSTGKSTKSGKS
jgi:hypothetical protein